MAEKKSLGGRNVLIIGMTCKNSAIEKTETLVEDDA